MQITSGLGYGFTEYLPAEEEEAAEAEAPTAPAQAEEAREPPAMPAMGRGRPGEIRRGPDGKRYRWVQGRDAQGKRTGFWRRLRPRVAAQRRPLPPRSRPRPGAGPGHRESRTVHRAARLQNARLRDVMAMNVCQVCGIPQDAGFFDESTIKDAPLSGQELVLARYELHRNYCGMLLYFAQFTDRYAKDPTEVQTPGYEWQIRCDGQPRDPYLTFDRIINPWGLSGFPIYLRLEEGCVLEFIIRKVGDDQNKTLTQVGGRTLGRYWYNNVYGGAPNRL